MTERRLDNPITATLAGVRDQFRPSQPIGQLTDADRLDGRTALVTGANSGLGKAIAIRLAARGARVLMACRGGIPEAGEAVRREAARLSPTTPPRVEMRSIDLSDLAHVGRFCDRLAADGERLDIVVLNAAVMPRADRRSAQGFELMFAVNYLANVALLHRLLSDGVLPNTRFCPDCPAPEVTPRLIVVASEAHRSAAPIDPARLGEYTPYNAVTGMAHYARTKALLIALANHLAAALSEGGEVEVAVHAMCPGAVNSNLAREAPVWVKPLLSPLMALLFRSPFAAAEPAVYLACAPELDKETGLYLHLMSRKEPADQTRDPELGAALWRESLALLRPHMDLPTTP